MNYKSYIFFILSAFSFSCNSEYCEIGTQNSLNFSQKSFLEFTKLSNNRYQLILENGITFDTTQLLLKNCRLYNLENNKIFLSKDFKIGESFILNIGLQEFAFQITEQLVKDNENIYVLTAENLYFFNNSKGLNARLYFSWSQGFIGSYLFDNNFIENKNIISPCGIILEDIIDLSQYNKRTLE